MKMKMTWVVMVLVAGALVSAQGQQPTLNEPLLDAMTGKWVLSGTIMGKQTTHDVQADWVLNHQFVRIHEVSREKTAAGAPQYDAWIFVGWDDTQKLYVIHWLDVYGGGYSGRGKGKRDHDAIAFVFHYENENTDFHTTFAHSDYDNTWHWDMDGEKDGKLTPFARLTLKRP
jgi:hypothetical protein